MQHNEVKEELAQLYARAFTPSAVRDEPKINPSNQPTDNEGETSTAAEERGDLLVRGLWERGKHCVIDVRITDINQPYQQHKPPDKILREHEKNKKKKYLEACKKNRRNFTPFIISTDGLLGKETDLLLRKVALQLTAKWHLPYSQVINYVRTRIAIAITRATHLCIRGSRVPVATISNKYPIWEDGAGISLT